MILFLSTFFLFLGLFAIFKIRRFYTQPNYTDKTVWITGASSGIGQYLAYQFANAGANLILSARNQNQLERVKNSCVKPDKVEVVKMDMVDFERVKQITEQIFRKLKDNNRKLDVVIENAGISMRSSFINNSFENHRKLFDVNVHGPYNHIQLVAKHMIDNKSGHIVGITSIAGKLGPSQRSSYSGSKHAFIGILDSIRCELRPFGIKVTNIMPGYVKTNISINAYCSVKDQKFGATDSNINKGMKSDKFAKIAVKQIFNGENQVIISEQWTHIIGIFCRNIYPDLLFYGLFKNAKSQVAALQKKE